MTTTLDLFNEINHQVGGAADVRGKLDRRTYEWARNVTSAIALVLPVGLAVGQTIIWNGVAWAPGTNFGAQNLLTSGTLGAGAITGTSLKASGLATGVGHLDGAGLLSSSLVVDADIGNLTISVGKLAQGGATTGQAVTWNGLAWAPGAPAVAPGAITGGGTNQLLWSAAGTAAWSSVPILATSLQIGVTAGSGSLGIGVTPITGTFGITSTVDGTIGLFTSNSVGPTHTQVRVENLGGQNCGFNLRTNNNNIGMRALVGANQDLDFSNFDGTGAFLAEMLQINTANARINAWGNFFWDKTVASPNITHTARTTDSATTNLTITSQAPVAGATGANRNPGNLVYVVPTPAAGGTAGKHSMFVSGAEIWAVESTGVRVTTGAVSNTLSAAAGPSGTTTLVLGGSGGGSLQVGSGRFAPPASASSVVMQFVSANETDFNGLVKVTNNAGTFFKIILDGNNSSIQFDKTAASPTFLHNAQTTDVATTNLTITSQAPAAGATGTNRNAGSLIVSVPAPTAGGAAGSQTFNVSAAQVLKLGAATIGLYTTTPVTQPTAVGALTDSTTGTPATTLVDVGIVFSQANINNNFSSVLTKLNSINTKLSQALGGIGLTA